MKPETPTQAAPRRPQLIRWVAWGLLILLCGGLAVQVGTLVMSVAQDGWGSRKLPFLLFIVVFVVGFFCLKALTNPIRDRGDERRAWRERFPKHTEQEIERFLRVIADSLLTSDKQRYRLRPDDTAAALTQEWLCGDGLDLVELLMAIEYEYGLELPESFHERDRTLGDLFDYVSHHRAGHPSNPDSAKSDQAKTG